MSAELNKLIEGNKQFRKKFFNEKNTIFNELLEGQRPKTMVIACSDSRVDPAMIFNCLPGELFVIRNIANLVPPCESSDSYHGISAALEFGTCFLQVKHIIVLGHTQCGGIQALIESSQQAISKQPKSFITKWMELAQPAYKKVMQHYQQLPLQEQVVMCGKYALLNSLKNLQTFEWIAERVQKNTLSLHAWYFDLATGGVSRYQQTTDEWILS